MTTTILEAIAEVKYLATPQQLASLVSLVADGKKASGTYLQVLVAYIKEEIGDSTAKKISPPAMTAEVDKVQQRLYPQVMQGFGEDTDAVQKNRRATFARTAASDLRAFIGKGGDVRTLDPATITKGFLRRYGRKVPTGTRAERSFSRSSDALLRAARRIAKTDAKEAAVLLRDIVARAQDTLAKIEARVEKPAKVKEAAKVVELKTAAAKKATKGQRGFEKAPAKVAAKKVAAKAPAKSSVRTPRGISRTPGRGHRMPGLRASA